MIQVIPEISEVAHRGVFGMLHAHRFLFRVGLSLANVFAWIFVYQYFLLLSDTAKGALLSTIFMYCIAQITTIILTPFSAAHLRRSVKNSLVFGALLASAAYIYLGAALGDTLNSEPLGWGIVIFALLLGAYRAIYWIPYQLQATTDSRERFRIPIIYETVIALMPAFAGATLVLLPFAPLRLLFGAALLLIVSIIPLIYLHDAVEGFSWNYGETFQQLFAGRHRTILSSSFIQGLQGAVLFLLWPIAAFLIVGSDYETLGIVLSATLLAVMILRWFYRWFSRGTVLENSAPIHATFSVSGWILRLFAGTPFAIFFADSYSYVSEPKRAYNIDPFVFEQSADQGSFIDEYTALKEMGLALGRIFASLLFGLFLLWTTLAFAFACMLILAAIASVASVIIERRSGLVAY